ncbi:MAG: C-type lectin domain-containing protein [Halieaceae bacterium]|nr:C-type lectin domain-containing protein [Halieaceae bacterium]
MHLASVANEDEHRMVHRITRGAETWLGGCRKATSRQPPDIVDPNRFHGAEDWEWNDGTPWSFTRWSEIEPNNGSNEEDRVCLSENVWCDRCSANLLSGIYHKPRNSPPLEAIRALVTDRHVLAKCFSSDYLRGILVCILYRVLAMKDSTSPVQPPADKTPNGCNKPTKHDTLMSAITMHVETEWPNLFAMLQAIRRAPPELYADDQHCSAFLSYFVAASAILHAPAPNTWKPLPETADDWSWPPGPLVPLRAACKIVQAMDPDTVRVLWPVLADAIGTVLVRMVDAVRADPDHAVVVLSEVFNHERKSSLGTYTKQLRRARRDPTFPEFKATASSLGNQLAKLQRRELRVQSTSSFPKLYQRAHQLRKRYNEFIAQLAQKCAGAKALPAPLKGMGRSLEKLVLRPGAAAEVKAAGVEAVDATSLVDVLRGSVESRDFTNIVFVLDLLQLLDVDLGDPKKAMAAGWDLKKFQIRILSIKDRFTTPTSGGWADAMVNFTFVHGDDTRLVMELQLQVLSFIRLHLFLRCPMSNPPGTVHVCSSEACLPDCAAHNCTHINRVTDRLHTLANTLFDLHIDYAPYETPYLIN